MVLDNVDARTGFEQAEVLRLAISSTSIQIMYVAITVTVSVGIADSSHAAAPSQVLSEADRALYAAKAAGRNRCITIAANGIEPVCPAGKNAG